MQTSVMSRRGVLGLLASLGIPATDAQTPAKLDANGGRIVFENRHARVIEHSSAPRASACGPGLHTHPPHLVVRVTDTRSKITREGRSPFVAEGKLGTMYWDPGGLHVTENLGKAHGTVYLVEFKDT